MCKKRVIYTHLATAKDKTAQFASLFFRNPGRKQYAESWECGAFSEAHQDTQND